MEDEHRSTIGTKCKQKKLHVQEKLLVTGFVCLITLIFSKKCYNKLDSSSILSVFSL